MILFRFIDARIFLISFSIGMFFSYIFSNPPEILRKIKNNKYNNDKGTCYQVTKIDCDKNK